MFSGKAANNNFIVFGLTRSGFEPTIEHANHYNTDVIVDIRDTDDLLAKNKINIINGKLNLFLFEMANITHNFIYYSPLKTTRFGITQLVFRIIRHILNTILGLNNIYIPYTEKIPDTC